MEWQAWAVAVAIVALLVSNGLTYRGQRLQERHAEQAAARAEASAVLIKGYSRRVVEALEVMAARPPGTAVAQPKSVTWALGHHAGDTFILENTGTMTAHDIAIFGHESLGGIVNPQGGPDLRPGEAITFMAAPSLATSDTTITVTWDERKLDGQVEGKEWRRPLPPAPRRQSR